MTILRPQDFVLLHSDATGDRKIPVRHMPRLESSHDSRQAVRRDRERRTARRATSKGG